jgi:hypothetical protein
MCKYGRLANGSNNQLCKWVAQIKSNHIIFHIHQPCELGQFEHIQIIIRKWN